MIDKRYGVVPPAEQAALSGLEFVQKLVSGALPHNSMARTLGYDIVEAALGRVVVTATPTADLLNPAGTVHGGFSATLLDTCMGLAVLTTVEKGSASTTLEFKISFTRPITPESGLLRAEGTVVSGGRRIGTAEGRLVDAAGRLLAHATTTCLIFER
ncbi:MAG: PaaI family thioesterase [Alphaproteobacteria bacterium]|nr:PaaI family thioesterase [Alphaproteobacteria bacterium]